MSDANTAAKSEFFLKLILRVFGATSLFALIFVAAPYSWMNAIHLKLGMGTLPDAPVVGYLARSTSAFYALLGGLFLLVSFDLARYRMLLSYLGIVITLFGIALLSIDWSEGMPFFWKLWEGPIVTAFGLAVFLLNRANKSENGA